jgi:Flp pilus assembly protein TadG
MRGGRFRQWALMVAVLWPLLFIVLGLIGDFGGAEVARSALFAAAIATGSVLAQTRRQSRG